MNRRGVALLLAVFALVVVGTTTAAYVASRDTSVRVAVNAQQAADARALASAGVSLAAEILRDGSSGWRTKHTAGCLLSNYALDGGTITVNLVDIEARDAGTPNPVPTANTTEVEVQVTSNRNGTTWSTVADMSIPCVAYGQYAIFVERYMNVWGSLNFIGRWPNAPLSEQRLRVNMATAAKSALKSLDSRVPSTGVYLETGTTFETKNAGAVKGDPDSTKPAWIYYPNDGSKLAVQGGAADKVATKLMEAGKTVSMGTVPDTPTALATATRYTSDYKISAKTQTLGPFKVKAASLITFTPLDWEVKDSSVITLTAGTYEVWGCWKLTNSRIIIQGEVKIVVNPNLLRNALEWDTSSVELDSNGTLEIYAGYNCRIRNCWVGSHFVCTNEGDAVARDGDPHMRSWLGSFKSSVCYGAAPSHPLYMEPWRVRFYPVKSMLASAYSWEFRDSCIIGSIFLPTNTLRCYGASRVYGRVACRNLSAEDTANFYYDHALDEISGLTEGTAPERGGDPDQLYPVRIIKYGFDAETSR